MVRLVRVNRHANAPAFIGLRRVRNRKFDGKRPFTGGLGRVVLKVAAWDRSEARTFISDV